MACDTADAEETALIILVLTPAFCIGPFARKFELMNISSSSGSSGVIFPRYIRSDEPSSGSSVAQMNESSLTKDRRLPSPYTSDLNRCIPTNVTPKTAISHQNGQSRNGHLRLCWRKRDPPVVLRMSGVDMASSKNSGQILNGSFQANRNRNRQWAILNSISASSVVESAA